MGGHPGRLAVLVILLVSGVLAEDDPPAESKKSEKSALDFKEGELNRCIQKNSKTELKQLSIGANPGRGWDILDFTVKYCPVELTYNDCQPTPDGQHFIPDQVSAITKKQSTASSTVKSFESVKEYSSSQAKSFSIGASVSVASPGFPGAFSASTQATTNNVKKSSSKKGFKTVMATSEYMVKKFELRLRPAPKLAKEFKAIVKRIGASIVMNKPKVADYYSDTLVEKYGTHVIDSVTVGGKIVRTFTTQISTTKDTKSQMSSFENSVKVSAGYGPVSASVNTKYKKEKSSSESSETSNSVQESDVEIFGGDSDSTLAVHEWVKTVDKNMAAIDKGGKTIIELITKAQFPGYKYSTLKKISEEIAEAIGRYYKENTIAGCMDINEPGFDPQASLEDKSLCRVELQPSFGGFYGFLRVSNPRRKTMESVENPAVETGYSCPENYHSVLLDEDTRTYDNAEITSTSRYCVGMVETQLYYFGGYLSKTSSLKECPRNFYDYEFKPTMSDLKLCFSTSDDAKKGSIPFGGMYTCDKGNPLAMPINVRNKLDADQVKRQFYRNLIDAEKYPHACPQGYKNETALMQIARWDFDAEEDAVNVSKDAELKSSPKECPVVICVGQSRATGLRKIRKPPFSQINPEDLDFGEVVYDDLAKDSKEDDKPIALFVVITLGVLAMLVIVAVVIVLVLKKRKKEQAMDVGKPTTQGKDRSSTTFVPGGNEVFLEDPVNADADAVSSKSSTTGKSINSGAGGN